MCSQFRHSVLRFSVGKCDALFLFHLGSAGTRETPSHRERASVRETTTCCSAGLRARDLQQLQVAVEDGDEAVAAGSKRLFS